MEGSEEYKEEAEKEAARYRDGVDSQIRKAAARCNTLRNISYTIQDAAARRTKKMKNGARLKYVKEMEKLKQLRERLWEVRWKRLEAEEERRQRKEAREEMERGKSARDKEIEPEKEKEKGDGKH